MIRSMCEVNRSSTVQFRSSG